MKRDKRLIALSHDHYEGLKLAQSLKKGSPPSKSLPNDLDGKRNYTIQFYNSELLHHFDEEENVIQPLVRGKRKDIDTLFDEIINEHKEIAEKVKSLNENKNIEEKLNELGLLLEAHIRKEERVLFKKIEEMLKKDT